MNNFKLLDCTIRDGGYLTKWDFTREMVRDIYIAISKAGIDFFEIGYLGVDNPQTNLWKKCLPEDVGFVRKGLKGAKICAMMDYNDLIEVKILPPEKSNVDMLRIALHKNRISEGSKYLKQIKEMGYMVAVQLMGITSYSDDELTSVVKMLSNKKCATYLYIADSYGSLVPTELERIIEIMKANTDSKIGFHPHNNLQMALGNALKAIECKIDIIDGTLYGMGRGAGNLPMESLIAFLSKSVKDKYNILPVLDVIDRYLLKIRKEVEWGYSLSYLLSGVYEFHPYYTRDLLAYREFSIEDILRTVKRISKEKPIGYSREILEKFVKSDYFEKDPKARKTKKSKVLKEELDSFKGTKIKYKDRHKNKDFLVLANGPNLKNYRDKIDEFIKKYDPVILGANYLEDLFIPHYHAFNNKKRFINYYHYTNPRSMLMLGPNLHPKITGIEPGRDFEELIYINSNKNRFDIIDGIITSNCRTISILLIGIAIVMGAERIFAVGMDGYFIKGSDYHFYSEDEAEDIEIIKEKHNESYRHLMEIENYLEIQNKEGIHILTPTSYDRFFKGIDNYL
jgi:4-hydroxy 2-oxovalerate aldolase